jgi:nitrite reductase (NO-forming)
MVDIAFEPTELTIPANTDVTINLTNGGALPHAFEVTDQGIASDEVPGGGSTSVVVNLPPGEYAFICPVPGHADAGMVGTLIVEEGGGAAAPADGGEAPAEGDGGEASGAPTSVDLNMVDIAFEPVDFTIAANTEVTLNLTNSGALPHAFQLEDGSVESSELPGGGTETLTLNLPPGTYSYICPVPGHADAGMVGTITVE